MGGKGGKGGGVARSFVAYLRQSFRAGTGGGACSRATVGVTGDHNK